MKIKTFQNSNDNNISLSGRGMHQMQINLIQKSDTSFNPMRLSRLLHHILSCCVFQKFCVILSLSPLFFLNPFQILFINWPGFRFSINFLSSLCRTCANHADLRLSIYTIYMPKVIEIRVSKITEKINHTSTHSYDMPFLRRLNKFYHSIKSVKLSLFL